MSEDAAGTLRPLHYYACGGSLLPVAGTPLLEAVVAPARACILEEAALHHASTGESEQGMRVRNARSAAALVSRPQKPLVLPAYAFAHALARVFAASCGARARARSPGQWPLSTWSLCRESATLETFIHFRKNHLAPSPAGVCTLRRREQMWQCGAMYVRGRGARASSAAAASRAPAAAGAGVTALGRTSLSRTSPNPGTLQHWHCPRQEVPATAAMSARRRARCRAVARVRTSAPASGPLVSLSAAHDSVYCALSS